jgi:hypothetical protein
MMPQKHAEFEFFSATEHSEVLQGLVALREGEMILEVQHSDGTLYDIRGKAIGALFHGQHQERPGDASVRAKWILLENTYVGIWVEDGRKYLFEFRFLGPE